MTEDVDLTHTTLNRWPSLTPKLNTWNNKLLDHIYISRNSAAHVTAAGIETGRITYKSDHNMVGTRIKFSKILGRTKNSNERYQPPKRILKYVDKEKVELYKKYIKKRHRKRKEKNKDMVGKVDKAITLARKENLTNKEKKELKNLMNSAMKAAIKEMLAAEKDINQEENNTSSTTFKGGAKARRSWSDTYAKKVTIINLLKATMKYCNIPKHRKKISTTIKKIACTDASS